MDIVVQGTIHIVQEIRGADNVIFEYNGTASISYHGRHTINNRISQSPVGRTFPYNHLMKSLDRVYVLPHTSNCIGLTAVLLGIGVYEKVGRGGKRIAS